ncbi:MAG: hypothetical protein ICV87_10330, partial [Gemmatimonadetes bacterium]|nr:hypothetical protein [Gemmatimonadota bacterium]
MTNLAAARPQAAPLPAAPPARAAGLAPWLVLALARAYVVVAPNPGVHKSEIESYDVWRGLQIGLLVA